MKMHADQVDVGAEVVSGLVAYQFPEWRDLPLRTVPSHGTVNSLFRLGDELVLRLPHQHRDGRHRSSHHRAGSRMTRRRPTAAGRHGNSTGVADA